MLTAACANLPERICQVTPFGNPSEPAAIEILTTDDGGASLRTLGSGGAVLLNRPPQGGYVVFLGIKARNLDPCAVTMSAELRDGATGQSLGYGERFWDLEATLDDWSSSQPNALHSFIHLPLCPNRAQIALVGESHPLEILVGERNGRTTSTRLTVTTECPRGDTQCECQCSASYLPGRC